MLLTCCCLSGLSDAPGVLDESRKVDELSTAVECLAECKPSVREEIAELVVFIYFTKKENTSWERKNSDLPISRRFHYFRFQEPVNNWREGGK